jgi:hypothetical protein
MRRQRSTRRVCSARRPAEGATAQDVTMQVGDGFTGVWAGVDDQPIASFLEPSLQSNLSGFQQEVAQQRLVRRPGFGQAGDRLLGDDQDVHGGLRADIVKGEDLVIFINDPGRNLAVDDPLKNAPAHVNARPSRTAGPSAPR